MTHLHIERLADGLLRHTAAFADAVAGADWERRVPTCPRWPLRVLVGHVGQGRHWAAGVVRGAPPDGVPDPRAAVVPPDWRAWLLAGATALADTVREAGAEARVWTPTGPGPASSLLRQAAHDTAVHSVDAALMTGAPYGIERDLAADAVSLNLELLSSPAIVASRPALTALRGTGTIALRPTDGPVDGWVVTRRADGVSWRHGTAPADVTVTATAETLILVLMHRLPPHDATVEGDHALFAHWLEHNAL
ncbi:maleylpyruvate isomerase family mycothiol-dependent enzyme [Streptomyces sp. NPDC050560]|uniref:maleylpyruvate isomerase family mycothiol-dependent enzyme n=1 Tax=Streptomyces sp. NPDC050560 TaxID=3365630 RepID=UPI0037951466